MTNNTLGLFEGVGIEIEYMIVNKESLSIVPSSDAILSHFQDNSKHFMNEVALGDIAISNELVMHVIEFKTNGPKPTLTELDQKFHETVLKTNEYLSNLNCQLLPTGTHPLLRPLTEEIKLWPYGDKAIYNAYNKIFGCRGHGWSNLQSMHINLPFANNNEFVKLHNAIRVVLPIIPALTASTPIFEGQMTDVLDNRLQFYGKNQALIPEISGSIIPELIQSKKEYKAEILDKMYQAISSYDPNKILQHEWLNSRGAIARFERNAIEIRIVDTQESPKADIACAAAIIGLLKYLIYETSNYLNDSENDQTLINTYHDTIKNGLKTPIQDENYWKIFNFPTEKTAHDFWNIAINKIEKYVDPTHLSVLQKMISRGNLAECIKNELSDKLSSKEIISTYKKLANCLSENRVHLCETQ